MRWTISWLGFTGETFRFKPDGILINTGAAYRSIHGPRANVGKTDFYVPFRKIPSVSNTLNSTDPKIHSRKRRILNTAFSEKTLRSSESFIIKHANRWCELLLGDTVDGWTKPTNVSNQCDYLLFDIMGDLSFGKSFDIKEQGENGLRRIPKAIHEHTNFLWTVSWL